MNLRELLAGFHPRGLRSASLASLEEAPKATDPAPTLGWETIAFGKYRPGVRSRHGLVYDRGAKAAVLFGGVFWTSEWNFQADTWELHGGRWGRVRTTESPPARRRGGMVYLDNREQTLLFGGQGQFNELLGDACPWLSPGRQANGDARWRGWQTRDPCSRRQRLAGGGSQPAAPSPPVFGFGLESRFRRAAHARWRGTSKTPAVRRDTIAQNALRFIAWTAARASRGTENEDGIGVRARRRKAGEKERMKASYKVRPSAPSRLTFGVDGE